MSKIGNALQMLFYLNNHTEYVKITEIANYIEIGEREVRRYRDDLEQAGFFIENQTGSNGGYRLVDKLDFSLGINQMETLLSKIGNNDSKKAYQYFKSTITLLSKMKNEMIISNNYIDDDTMYKIFSIQSAKQNKNKMLITYLSYRYGQGKYIVEPYFLKMERNQYYLFAKHDGLLKMYKTANIINMETINEKYEINDEMYSEGINDNSFGVFRSTITYEVKIEVTGKINDHIDSFFDNRIELINETGNIKTYILKTHNLKECLYTILSLGSNLKVIGPDELKKMYENEVIKMLKNI